MEAIYNFAQFILAVALFLAALSGSVSFIVRGSVDTLLGYVACLLFIALTWLLVAQTWREMRKGE